MREVETPAPVADRWPFVSATVGDLELTFKLPSLQSKLGIIQHRYVGAMLKAQGYQEDLAALGAADPVDAEAVEKAARLTLLHYEGSAGLLLADLWHPALYTLETDRSAYKGQYAALEYGCAVCEELSADAGLTWKQIAAIVQGLTAHAFKAAPESSEVNKVEVFFGRRSAPSP